MTRLCNIDGCGGRHKGHGLCDKHVQRLRRLGTTDDPKWQTFEERFWSKVDRRGPDDCWPWTAATNEHGYGVMRPAGKRTGPSVKAHRVSAELAGMTIIGLYVLHSCDNPICVNPSHLRPGTALQNSRDMVSRLRTCHGERRPQARLTAEQVIAIRQRHAAGESRPALAAEFGTSNANIGHILNGNTWRHLLPTPPMAEVVGSALVEAITGESLETAS